MIDAIARGSIRKTQYQTEHSRGFLLDGEDSNSLVRFEVLPGITVLFYTFHSDRCETSFRYTERILTIDYCREGRVEWQRKTSAFSYLGEQHLQISTQSDCSGTFGFPTRHFHGVTVCMQPETAEASLQSAQEWFPVNPQQIYRKFAAYGEDLVLRGHETLVPIMNQMSCLGTEASFALLRLKTLELLMALQELKSFPQNTTRQYYPRSVVEKIHSVRELLCSDLTAHYTLPELAARFELSETMLKRCFRSVYGNSVHAFLKNYRLEAGAAALQQTGRSISEIAMDVGYENPSKFTAAFRAQFGMTPSQFRRVPAETERLSGTG